MPSAYGFTRKGKLHQIEPHEGTVKDLETSPEALGAGENARGKNVYVAGVRLRDELCHVGYYRDGKAEKKEAGFAFENATYGKSVP